MTTLSAYLYDGQTAQRRNVTVKLTVPGYIVLQEFSTLSRFRLEDVAISEQLGSQPARVELPDGARLEVADSQAFYAELSNASGQNQWLHKLESRWSFAILALLLTLGYLLRGQLPLMGGKSPTMSKGVFNLAHTVSPKSIHDRHNHFTPMISSTLH